MKNWGQCIIITLVVFIAVLALFEVDRRCSDMYGTEGKLSQAAASVMAQVESSAGGE